jgi:hypothetical protein
MKPSQILRNMINLAGTFGTIVKPKIRPIIMKAGKWAMGDQSTWD